MRKHRFFYSANIALQGIVSLDKATSHHILKVLRLKKGAIIYLFNNSDLEFTGVIHDSDNTSIRVLITKSEPCNVNSKINIHLCLGIIKFDTIDLILQKACELGINHIKLIVMDYTNIKNAYLRTQDKLSHWRKILESSTAQCWRTTLPTLEVLEHPQSLFDTVQSNSLKLVLSPHTKLSYQLFNDHNSYQDIYLLIGPEGGFSEQELSLAQQYGFQSIYLGPRILRTETACFSAMSLIQARFGDLLHKDSI